MQTDDELQPLFSHRKRPGWGLAILASEGGGQRLYQFQDGQLRTFKTGYYELLEEVLDHPPERALDLVRDLRAMLRIERGKGRPRPRGERLPSFVEQLRALEARFPAGFSDSRWVALVRGGEGPRTRRHRAPAIAEAREQLAEQALEELLSAGRAEDVLSRARGLLARVDLVGSKDAAPLRRATEHAEPLARALRALLWGEGSYDARLTTYLGVLARLGRVTWPLLTVFPALVHPDEHPFVKPSVVRPQALWVAPSLIYEASPSVPLYERLRAMLEEVRRRLVRAGHAPRDLLDVHDFMVETLRPRTEVALEELPVLHADAAE